MLKSLHNSIISERTEEQFAMTAERAQKQSIITTYMQGTEPNRQSTCTELTEREGASEYGGYKLDHKMSHQHSPQIQVVDQSAE